MSWTLSPPTPATEDAAIEQVRAFLQKISVPRSLFTLIRVQFFNSAVEKLAHNPGLSWYFEKDGQVYYECCHVLIQQRSDDPSVYPDYIQMDGEYGVLINTGTGVVEDIFYDAALAGNG